MTTSASWRGRCERSTPSGGIPPNHAKPRPGARSCELQEGATGVTPPPLGLYYDDCWGGGGVEQSIKRRKVNLSQCN